MEQFLIKTDEALSHQIMPLVNQNILHVIYDRDCRIVACSELSARSVGLSSWYEAVGASYQDTDNLEYMKMIFGCKYNNLFYDKIAKCAKKILSIHKAVLNNNRIISYIDYMPYNEVFVPYLITCAPIAYNGNQAIGIQSFAQKCDYLNILSHTQIIRNMFEIKPEIDCGENNTENPVLTKREHEIVFLLANGLSTDEIFEFLGTSRSTISNIIASRLSPKFGLFGSSAKLLSKIAKKKGYHKLVPESLSVPCVIILDEQLSNEIH